ncbi:OmpA family protein [Flavihumibacter rivuli]|uniref:OmpA family protein n=1 Tax=Flavihumibacter rivuli TaxID=2838156 RepID=UPI001BDEF880|nr:OmpA family protein [Flavihumibacter rivuli]ULQ56660.1 OmpA family protein [Flavihumibacter rivuli]
MASKKNAVLFGLLCLFSSAGFAQIGASYDVTDSSLIPRKRLPQHNEFMNNTYPFPAKPRNQWEVGLKVGAFSISGDVPAVFPTAGFGFNVRKALGYVFSLRMEYVYGMAKGLHWSSSGNYGKNSAWVDNGYVPARRLSTGQLLPVQDEIYYNYKTNVQDLQIQGLVSLNNILFHKAQPKTNLYALVGIGGMIYDTKVNALNGDEKYDFSTINGNVYSDRKDTKKQLRDLLDDSYETDGEKHEEQKAELFGKTFRPVYSVGLGFSYRLGQRISLSLEDRFTITKDDLLDGQRWQEAPAGDAVLTRDYDTYNFLSLGVNYAFGKNRTAPLYWMNPLDYAYNELNAPKHMKMPKPVLDDADGDGVTDQFDLEPNTPQGAPVDSHGVSKDTDGDGVPDFKDKELITPTQCQPVDADGVGKCPEPECCKNIAANMVAKPQCAIGDLPSISFTGRSVSLSADAKAVLASVAEKLRNNPTCKVSVIGYGESSKSAQQLSWDRVNAVINYLIEKEGISADRFIFKYGEGGGDTNTVDLRDATGEEGPNAVPAPHPNLRKKG